MEKAMSAMAGDQDKSDEKLFPNSQLTVKEAVILLLGDSTKTADWLEHNDVKWLVLHNCPCAKKRSSK